MVLLEWTIYGFSGEKKIGLLASQRRSFWQSWVNKNEPQHIPPVKCIKWLCMKEEPVWGNEVVNDKLSTALDTCFSGQTVAALGFTAVSQQSREIPLMRADLPKRHVTSSALQGLQLMTNDYIKGNAGFYMTLEGFSNSICISREMRTHGREDSIFSSLSPARSCSHSNKRPRVPLVSNAHGRKIPTHELSGLELCPQCC